MIATTTRRRPRLRRVASSGTLLALDCARGLHGAVDRRMPEAAALAAWLAQHAATFGLPDAAVPDDDDRSASSRRRGVTAQDWRKIGAALAEAAASLPTATGAPADRGIAAIADRLALDPLDARILVLALHYRLDQRIERLFDAISECRTGTSRFRRDAGLIALLLQAPPAEVATRLTAEAKLLASGLLQLDGHGQLTVLDRLVSLLRRDVLPAADLYDQLLGAIAAEPLPWDAFAHLGREAEVAAGVLAAALCGGKTGVNMLLYGAPATGKIAFAATLAACGSAWGPDADRGDCPETWGIGRGGGKQALESRFRCARRVGMADCPS